MPDVLRPHPGPQEAFLSSPADIVIFGGAAGGGKSEGLLFESIRHHQNPGFGGVIFRRKSTELTGSGSLWAGANRLYRLLGASMIKSPTLRAEFPSGALMEFRHLQYDDTVFDHQGKEYAFIGFDEVSHFSPVQFWYMVSRLRTTAGVRPCIRATTNPDPDSFIRQLIDWWIGEDGYPIEGRSGVLRWFHRDGNELYWGDSKQDLIDKFGDDCRPMSLTFIPAKLQDNPTLMTKDPEYLARLNSLPEIERLRLLGGNWDVRHTGGKFVRYDYFTTRWTRDAIPGCVQLPKDLNIYTSSDFAVTAEEDRPDGDEPDNTEHGVFGIDKDDNIYVLDWWWGRTTSDVWIEALIDLWAEQRPRIALGEGGVIRRAVEPFLKKRMKERRVYAKLEWINPPRSSSATLEGYSDRSKRAKAMKGQAFQARAHMGKIILPADAPWVNHVLSQWVEFPAIRHDDAFDVIAQLCMAIDQTKAAKEAKPKPAKSSGKWDKAFKRKKAAHWRVA